MVDSQSLSAALPLLRDLPVVAAHGAAVAGTLLSRGTA